MSALNAVAHTADALKDVIVTEEISPTTPFWAVLAIGLAGRLAADFGARVIRVHDGSDPLSGHRGHDSRPPAGAHLRALQDFLCAGKESLDRTASESISVSDADRFKARLSLRYDGDDEIVVPLTGPAAVQALPRKQVAFMEEVAGTGAALPHDSEFTLAARAGLLDIVGRSDSRPLMMGGHQISFSTGLSGFLAAAALLHSEEMDRAEVSALGTALWINWKSLAAAAQGRPIPRRSAENGKWRTAPCADGHVALVYFDRDWPQISKMTGDPDMIGLSASRAWTDRDKLALLERGLEAWALRHTRRQIADASKSFGLAFGSVWTPAELLQDPQYNARRFFGDPADALSAAGRRPRLPMVLAAQAKIAGSRVISAPRNGAPLAGMRVIDLGILTAGASTSAILADLGADVIKVESPTYLDPFRGTPGTSRAEGWWNNSDAFKSTNRNKRGICLDLKSERGRDVFLKLARHSDVVIENFRRGVMQRLGIGYEALRTANPGIVLASVSSQGEDGPEAGNISFGSTLEATSGLAALTAYADGIPLVTGMDLNYPDQVGSVFAAAAVVATLHATRRSRTGAHLDISQRELTTYLLGDATVACGDARIGRLGNASPEYVLQDAFATRDGWVAVTIESDESAKRALAMVPSHLNDDDIEAFRNSLTAWASDKDTKYVCRALKDIGIAAAPVFNGQEAWAYAEQAGAGAIRPLAHSPSGDIVKGFPLHLPGQPIAVSRSAPDLGQHTETVLREILEMSEDEIEALKRDNVIGTRPASPNASRLD